MTPAFGRRTAVLAILGAAALTGCGPRPHLPAFGYTLLDGSRGSEASLRGKVTLVTFWSTDCAPCLAEMPQLVATERKFAGRGFQTLAVSMSYDPPALVSAYAERHRLPFGVAIDSTGSIARSFGSVDATPTAFLVDKDGSIVRRYLGAPDFEVLDLVVERLLKQG
ncbi:MAG: TlpA family protein disulfide reductase [Burkholderiales bacterium]|nr:TlpA family protein disulfide reductase [Burkholderiales bacterium]